MEIMKVLTVIVGLLFLESCGKTDQGAEIGKREVTRIIINQSGYDVKLMSYFTYVFNYKIDSLQIDSGSIFKETAYLRFGDFGDISDDSEMINYRALDSAHIIFDGKKIARHCSQSIEACSPYPRNIIFHYFSSGSADGYIKSDTAKETCIYTITEEDYQNAEPL